jgi:polyhydroxyalkanoate synthesis regulator phasin
MADLGNLFQKAVYLGVGLASYTTEKASGKLGELRAQAQKLADELVQRGEMTAEEAKRMVEEMMQQSQQAATDAATANTPPAEPRKIDITDGDETDSSPSSTTDYSGNNNTSNSASNSASNSTDNSTDNSTTSNNEPTQADVQSLRQQVEALQEQLRRLKD